MKLIAITIAALLIATTGYAQRFGQTIVLLDSLNCTAAAGGGWPCADTTSKTFDFGPVTRAMLCVTTSGLGGSTQIVPTIQTRNSADGDGWITSYSTTTITNNTSTGINFLVGSAASFAATNVSGRYYRVLFDFTGGSDSTCIVTATLGLQTERKVFGQ
jgi:hypothetical protein